MESLSIAGESRSFSSFIDGPGGTGKSFLFRCLYFLLISKGKQVQNMGTTGIASTLLIYGMTAHKTFNLDVPLRSDSESRVKVGTIKGTFLAKVDAFFLDEAPMLPRYGLENIDRKLRELRHQPEIPFGGAIVILGGDFRQCLPVQPKANQSELRNLSIKQSHLWSHFKTFSLSQNMRIDSEEIMFKSWTLDIGNGAGPESISIPFEMTSSGDLTEEVFGNA